MKSSNPIKRGQVEQLNELRVKNITFPKDRIENEDDIRAISCPQGKIVFLEFLIVSGKKLLMGYQADNEIAIGFQSDPLGDRYVRIPLYGRTIGEVNWYRPRFSWMRLKVGDSIYMGVRQLGNPVEYQAPVLNPGDGDVDFRLFYRVLDALR